jgi:hypothetical protein
MRAWVSVRYQNLALANTMALMRLWLDGRRCKPAIFQYERSGSDALIRIQFQREDEAAAFAQQFNGVISADRRPLSKTTRPLSVPPDRISDGATFFWSSFSLRIRNALRDVGLNTSLSGWAGCIYDL